MKIEIVCLGKLKDQGLREIEAEYLKRLEQFVKISVVELDNGKFGGLPPALVKKKEGELLLDYADDRAFFVALDEDGKGFTSESFAKLIDNRRTSGQDLVFAIGGAYGFDEAVLKRANSKLSLSTLTFTYQFARLLLVEQIYRASTIIKGTPYHKA